jgi:tetratricopeptide (TPR) repeat protein
MTMTKATILVAMGVLACAACGHGRNLTEIRASDAASAALSRGEYQQAVNSADEAIKLEPDDPWPYYNRGAALGNLKRTDEAIASFQQAEARFSDRWPRSISIWGRARAYGIAGKCEDAQRTWRQYADYVRTWDAESADMAARVAAKCAAPFAQRGPMPPEPIAGRWQTTCSEMPDMVVEFSVTGRKATGRIAVLGRGALRRYTQGEDILDLTADDRGEWAGQLHLRWASGTDRFEPIRLLARGNVLNGTMTSDLCYRNMALQ